MQLQFQATPALASSDAEAAAATYRLRYTPAVMYDMLHTCLSACRVLHKHNEIQQLCLLESRNPK